MRTSGPCAQSLERRIVRCARRSRHHKPCNDAGSLEPCDIPGVSGSRPRSNVSAASQKAREAVKHVTAPSAELRHPACCQRSRGRRHEDDELSPEGTRTSGTALPCIGCPASCHRGHQYHGNRLIAACRTSRMTMRPRGQWHWNREGRYRPTCQSKAKGDDRRPLKILSFRIIARQCRSHQPHQSRKP
jgi:hypothetical protein